MAVGEGAKVGDSVMVGDEVTVGVNVAVAVNGALGVKEADGEAVGVVENCRDWQAMIQSNAITGRDRLRVFIACNYIG